MLPHRVVRLLPLGSMVLLALACRKEPSQIAEPLADFENRVNEYAALRNRLADSLGPVDETKTQAEIAARASALAAAIANVRVNAKQGDIFTPEAATVIATMIKDEYTRRSESVNENREEHAEEYKDDGLPPFEPQVNQLFPTNYPLPTFDALLLPLLPKLPDHIEYRRMEHYLMIRDIDANLIVDFMPNAFPR